MEKQPGMLPNPERPLPLPGPGAVPRGELRQGVNGVQDQSSACKSDKQTRGIHKLHGEGIESKFISPIIGGAGGTSETSC